MTGSYFTDGTVWISPDMLPTLNSNVNLNYSKDEITTVHKWSGTEWIWVQVPSKGYYFELEDSSTIKVLVSDESELNRQSLAQVAAKTFAGLPESMRRESNGEYDYEFAIMNGYGGYYTGFSGVSNIVLNDQVVWEMSYEDGPQLGYLEELIAHELAHASLDKLIYNQDDWQKAVDSDSPFWISKYALDNPLSEDVAETVVPLLAIILYNRPTDVDDELRSFLSDTIKGIPNRYEYISRNIFKVSNFECLLDGRGWLSSSSGCELEPTREPTREPTPEPTPEPTYQKKIYGTKKNDLLKGSKKNDSIDGMNGNDELHGKNGNDLLSGNKGNDELYGDKGNDILIGNMGIDWLYGGKGRDTFMVSKKFGKGKKNEDQIFDFNDGEDMIEIYGSTSNIEIEDYGKHAFIVKGNDTLAWVKGAAGDLSWSQEGNFIL